VSPASDRDARVETLVRANAPALLRYFERRVTPLDDAADLLGETLLVLWRRVDAVPGDAVEARMWMFGVARRVLQRHRRRAIRGGELVERLRGELASATGGRSAEGGDPAASPGADDRAALAAALASLGERDREIVALVAWDGFSLADAARHLRLPAGTVRSRYSRARAVLRRSLAGDDVDSAAARAESGRRDRLSGSREAASTSRAPATAMRPGEV
jgi:RNA polymerase sigma-70 factor, ECF subfamily